MSLHALQGQNNAIVPAKLPAHRVIAQRCVIRKNLEVVIVQNGDSRWRGAIDKQNPTFIVDKHSRRLESPTGLVSQRKRASGIGIG